MTLARLVLLALVVLGGGASSPEPARIVIARPERLNGHAIGGAMPIVTLRLNGVPLPFLLDTGASETVLSEASADRLHLTATARGSGVDSAGAAVAGRYVGAVDLATADGVRLRHFERVLAAPLGPLDALGLAGVIGPQTLIERGCIRVDFPAGVATVGEDKSATCQAPSHAQVATPPGWRAGGRPMLDLTVGPHRIVTPFLLDSGASRSSLTAAAAVEVPRLRTSQSSGVAGKIVTAQIVGPVELVIGEHAVVLPEASVSETRAHGLLGFDALARTVLVFRADGGFALIG